MTSRSSEPSREPAAPAVARNIDTACRWSLFSGTNILFACLLQIPGLTSLYFDLFNSLLHSITLNSYFFTLLSSTTLIVQLLARRLHKNGNKNGSSLAFSLVDRPLAVHFVNIFN